MFNKRVVKIASLFAIGVIGSYATIALGGSETIGSVASKVTSTFSNIIKMITGGAYIGGTALVIAALFKFKQHKENPQQVQLGTCMTMLVVGVALIFLPSIIKVGGGTLYGGGESSSIGGTNDVTG